MLTIKQIKDTQSKGERVGIGMNEEKDVECVLFNLFLLQMNASDHSTTLTVHRTPIHRNKNIQKVKVKIK